MEDLLNDASTYKLINEDPINNLQKKSNDFVKKLSNLKIINENLCDYLTDNNSQAPKIYGLPKIHKPNYPHRPIVSFVESP